MKKNGEPFALAGIWENWKRPGSEEWVRTFAIITTNSNELVSAIHDRMPVIIAPEEYTRWLSTLDPDPRDLLVPYPTELMTMWPISIRVNKPETMMFLSWIAWFCRIEQARQLGLLALK